MKRLVQIVCLPELHPWPVMRHVFEEASGAFDDYGCVIRTVTSLDQLEDGGIAWIDNAGGKYMDPVYAATYHEMGRRCPHTVFICWYWDKDADGFRPFQRMIYTGEYYPRRELVEDPARRAYLERPDFVPLRLRANEPPHRIGTYSRQITRDYCYMGSGYKMDWLPYLESHFKTGWYHYVAWDNHLSYEERRKVYLSARFALGFQSDDNIRTGHLSQRLFEGMAYGCIVFCENPYAAEYTDGAVVHVTSTEDMVEKMHEFIRHPDRMDAQQQKGYEWVRQYGTNRVNLPPFLDAIQRLYGESFSLPSSSSRTNAPCVTVNLMGGLGNQLFQIAAGLSYALQHEGRFVLYKKQENGNRPVYWDTLLSSMAPYLVTEPVSLPTSWSEQEATLYTAPPPLPTTGIQLQGYLQSSKYYTEASKALIRHLFRQLPPPAPRLPVEDFLLAYRERVVVIHARRTDYLRFPEVHNPLKGIYYRRAIHRMLEKVSYPLFLLTSDDPTFWAEIADDLAEAKQYPVLSIDFPYSDLRAFPLLQQFQHYIMSNSTFIWWCVWLASDVKHVIAPTRWFGPAGPAQYEDIYEPSWERISSDP